MNGDRTHYVYEVYDSDLVLLYVGCTGKPRDRYRAHLGGNGDARGWFDSFIAKWRVSGPYSKAVALRIEGERIRRYQPIWNALTEGNRPGDYAVVKAYLAFHGVRFEKNPNRGRPDLVPARRSRRLRVVA